VSASSKSATETIEMLREVFGEHSLSRKAVFECHSGLKTVESQLKMTKVQGDQAPAKRLKMFKKFENSSTKTVAAKSMTPLGSVTEFARDLNRKFIEKDRNFGSTKTGSFIMTTRPPTRP
jgi:hypothetical protein